ncbi:MAG: hypothetical protein ACYDBQ_01720 [Thermoplasmatota archaeon]
MRGIAFAVALVLAGCAQPALHVPAGALGFPLRPAAVRDGGNVRWVVWLQNAGVRDSEPARLNLTVQYTVASMAQGPPEEAGADIPPLGAGQTQSYQVATTYVGGGDYTGQAQVLVAGRVADTVPLFFETCVNLCR